LIEQLRRRNHQTRRFAAAQALADRWGGRERDADFITGFPPEGVDHLYQTRLNRACTEHFDFGWHRSYSVSIENRFLIVPFTRIKRSITLSWRIIQLFSATNRTN